MTSGVLETVIIEGVDLESAPPCQVLHSWQVCERPAAARIFFRCHACPNKNWRFICQEALFMIRTDPNKLQCGQCLVHGVRFSL